MTRARTTAARAVGGLLAVAGMATVAAAVAATGAVFGTAPAGAADRDFPVGVRTRVFEDRSRPTPADVSAGIPSAPTRRLETTFFYPARTTASADGAPVAEAKPARGEFPVVVFSPGSPGTPQDYAPLLADWARAGYVVVGLQFPISSLAGPDDVAWADLPAQTRDARFVLGKVLGLDPAKAGIPALDPDRIAAAGHSFGGATALSLVSKCCRDARVDAAVILAGVTETVSGPRFRAPAGPVLFVHARYDRAVPYSPAADACATVRGPKRLLTVEGIRGLRAHVSPYVGDDPWAELVRPAIVDFLDGYVRDQAAARRRVDGAGAGGTLGAVTRCPTGDDPAPSPASPSA